MSIVFSQKAFEGIALYNHETWPLWFYTLFGGVIMLGLEILSRFVPFVFNSASKIKIQGEHLDKFEFKDRAFIFTNKLLTCLFVYHLCYVVYHRETIKWKHDEVTISNTLGSLFLFYIFYDFFYMNFHKLLHIRSLYRYVHHHHHRQKAPSRGNLDAINVHPFEFLVGEYLHLVTIYFIPCHIYAVVFFILAGGILASLNHTRLDVKIPWLYAVSVHDVHHRWPRTNYGQYTMFWDHIFGSYREFKIETGGKSAGDSTDDLLKKAKMG